MIFKKNNSFIKKYFLKEIFFLLIVLFISIFSTIATLPVLDRDEARFVQSSRQMIETNNYTNIKFQEEYRSKKPIGIYWMQSFFVKNTSEVLKIDNKSNKINNDHIWKYRMISALSSLASIIILFYLTNKLISRDIALLASLSLAASFLFVTEAHIAKTDSVLLTCSILVMLTMAGYYFRFFDKKNVFSFFMLWLSLAMSILIKGPILLIMCVVSSVFIIVLKKDINWLKNTSPLRGFILLLTIILPTFYLLISTGQENFIQESIINDFFNKIISVQEKHSAFLGAHSLSTWLLFFPMSIFLIPTFLFVKKSFSNKKVFFFSSWILPNLLILELIPTKLPHYTLPLYPALSILVAMMLFNEKNIERILKNKVSLLGYLFFLIITSALIIALGLGVYKLGNLDLKITLLTTILFLLNILSIYLLYKKKISTLFNYQIFISTILYLSIFLVYLPNMKQIWVSKRIKESLNVDYKSMDSRYIYALGYNEPSLVFAIGTNLNILKNLDKTVLKSKNLKYLILEQKYYENFIEIVQNNDIKYILIDKIKGFNSARSIPVEVNILKIFN
ncbi:MAG: hypothetical protein CMP24_04885 [Rickettsiales bacterium]|nr:hypothetical protein [Rickettsiales bacterium]